MLNYVNMVLSLAACTVFGAFINNIAIAGLFKDLGSLAAPAFWP